jgi:hypothetical protein
VALPGVSAFILQQQITAINKTNNFTFIPWVLYYKL